MRSSTSSSSFGGRLRAQRALGRSALFAAVFLSAATAGEIAARRVDVLEYAHPGPQPGEIPGDWYVDHGLGVNSFSHKALYHGFGDSVGNARRADVLLLGSSRVLAGFAYDVIEEFSAEHDLRVFNLGFGHGEGDVFPLRVMDRHDIRPRLYVVNAEYFFTGGTSRYADTVLAASALRRAQSFVEDAGEYLFRAHLRRFLPHFLPQIPIPVRRWARSGATAFLRSEEHGCWYTWNPLPRRLPIRAVEGAAEVPDWQVARALGFAERARREGAAVVLTLVPSALPYASLRSVQDLAGRLGAELVAPQVEGLTTFDDSHLDFESARRFTRAFLDGLEGTRAFAELR